MPKRSCSPLSAVTRASRPGEGSPGLSSGPELLEMKQCEIAHRAPRANQVPGWHLIGVLR